MTTFYKNYVRLCAQKGVSPSAAAEAVGLSRTSPNGWKKGKNPNDLTLAKLADYFGVLDVDLLAEEKEKSPAPESAELTETQKKAFDLIMQLDEKSLRRMIKIFEAVLEEHTDE